VCAAVSKALEQLDAANRDAAAAKQRAEQLEQELTRTQQQAQSAQTQVDRWGHSMLCYRIHPTSVILVVKHVLSETHSRHTHAGQWR
jgi:hypothetical protein